MKQATLHITELKGGKSLSLHLCENCAKEYLSTVEVGGVPEDFAGESSPAAGDEDEESSTSQSAQACPECGITFKQFRSQGRLGCPHDYEVFRQELLPLLESIHGETQHVGKIPPKVSEASRHQHELIRLRNELRSAVDEENYERAAEIRDQIQRLENSQEPNKPV